MAFQNLKSTGIAYLLGKLKDIFVQIKDSVRSVNGIEPNEDGDITVTTVPYAKDIVSSNSQKNTSSFIERTSGGTLSIEAGEGWLMSIKGNNVHDGFTPESITPDVESNTITGITVARDTFITKVTTSGTTTLTYSSGSWSDDLSEYGITLTGTPSEGDVITIVYVKEVRGSIVVSDPRKFISTGWNLYNHTNTYARVLKYRENNNTFMISGTYTAPLKFSATLSGTKTDITVTDGVFDPFENTGVTSGYVWVTGGNATDTAIWMTWDDWDDGYDGEFQPYSQTEVDFTSIMTSYFPNGLLKAGSVCDEINFNLRQAISRVQRIAYTDQARAEAEESGREFEFDQNYIYIARAASAMSENTHTITVEGEVVSDDHGMEIFTNTVLDVTAEVLYGNNLVNKLERDVLTISPQTLTPAQQAQVQQNIGVSGSLTNLFVEKSFTYDYSIDGNTNDSFNQTELGFSVPTGYEVFALKRFRTGNSYITVSNIYPHPTNVVQVRVRNVTNSTQTGTFGMDVIFIRTGVLVSLTSES